MKEEHGKVHGPVITFHRWYIVISRWRGGEGGAGKNGGGKSSSRSRDYLLTARVISDRRATNEER